MRSFLFFDLKMLAHTPQTHQAQFCTLKSRPARGIFIVSGYKIHKCALRLPACPDARTATFAPPFAREHRAIRTEPVATTLLSPVRATTVARLDRACSP
jgi:hypothetical protein